MLKIFFVDNQNELYAGQIALLTALGNTVQVMESDALFRHSLNKAVSIDLLITDFMGGRGTTMSRLVYLKKHCEVFGVPIPPVIVFSSASEAAIRYECKQLRVEKLLTAVACKGAAVREIVDGTMFIHYLELTAKVRELMAK